MDSGDNAAGGNVFILQQKSLHRWNVFLTYMNPGCHLYMENYTFFLYTAVLSAHRLLDLDLETFGMTVKQMTDEHR